jgi:hypothetical protein
VTHWCRENGIGHFKWQWNFYEHVVRNEKDLNAIREYIVNNPLKGHLDRENPSSDSSRLDWRQYFKNVHG